MRTNEFSSSDEDEGEEQLTPLFISWLPLSVVGSSQFLGICALPGCKYKDIRRDLRRDVAHLIIVIRLLQSLMVGLSFESEELQSQGVQEIFVFCTRGELIKYRVPSLLEVYQQHGFNVHHMPIPDGNAPEIGQCCQILDALQRSLNNNRRTLMHCYGGLGRSALIASCLLLQLSYTITTNKAIEILRELRGGGAIQTVKQYNFLHEFRERYTTYQESRDDLERSVSR